MSTTAQLLHSFLEAKGRFVSGSELGRERDMSRVAVHKHLERLRDEGFRFSAIRNRGYRLEKEPLRLHPDLLEALLSREPCPFFSSYLALESVGSTNSVAEAELSAGRKSPFFIIADTQTSGRGRRGRNWYSPPGSNLYLSLALRPSLPPSRLQTITLWLGLKLCDHLRNRLSLPVQIKWPNDLMLHGKKFAGMLTEARVDAESTRDLIFGLGLNVNMQAPHFPDEIRSIATSLALETGTELNISRLAHSILLVLAESVREFLEDDYADELSRVWPEYDYLLGQFVEAENIKGRALGIAPSGSLRIEREDGTIAVLQSGEVSLRKITRE